jgi:hypothetical protein
MSHGIPKTLVAFAVKHRLNLRRVESPDLASADGWYYELIEGSDIVAWTYSARPTVANALAMMRRHLAARGDL